MARKPRGSYAPITPGDLDALRRYADKHGRRWKLRLWGEWMNASAEPTLHALRNTHGPTWLDQFRWPAPAPSGPGDASAGQRVLDVSGGHLSPITWARLDNQTADDVVRDPANRAYTILGGRTRQGWFLRAEEVLDSTVPADLADVLRYVRRSGCSFVMLDCDCIPLAELPVLHPEFQDAKAPPGDTCKRTRFQPLFGSLMAVTLRGLWHRAWDACERSRLDAGRHVQPHTCPSPARQVSSCAAWRLGTPRSGCVRTHTSRRQAARANTHVSDLWPAEK